jgi:two-component system chemotaxis sensor kinase CheA
VNDSHVQAFFEEADEQVTTLNNALLALETDPDDDDAMDEVFRTAHTLKGNCGAMGFENAATLAHAIEDLLQGVRDGRREVDATLMDHVFDGVDHIELLLGELAEHGEERTGSEDLVAAIRAFDRECEAEGDEVPAPTPSDRDPHGDAADGTDPAALLATLEADVPELGDERLYHAAVTVDGQIKGVDGLITLERVRREAEILSTVPETSAIEEGEYDDGFDLYAVSPPDRLETVLEGVPAVVDHRLTDLTPLVNEDGIAEVSSVPPSEDTTESGDPPDTDGVSRTTDGDDIRSIRVNVDQLDDLYELVEQLVTSRIKLRRAVSVGDLDAASDDLDELDKITENLQGTVMTMRLVPLKQVVRKFPRLVRDVARSQEKQVQFLTDGEDIELDRTILTEIADPLMHLLRNAVDHGIESPADREAAGKPATATVELTARREGDHVTIAVSDDGRGLDVDAIREKALERGVVTQGELETMPDRAVFELVFEPGFSTATDVTDISGRGVGMDVVSSTVRQLDGGVTVDSEPGVGTTVTLRLPVTVAIVKVLFVTVGDREVGVPIKNIAEVSAATDVRRLNGVEVTKYNEEVYPVVRLHEALDIEARLTTAGVRADGSGGVDSAAPPAPEMGVELDGYGTDAAEDGGMLLHIRPSERAVALHCDAVQRQEEVVVKPLDGALADTRGLSGTAVLGGGTIVPVLDVVSL